MSTVPNPFTTSDDDPGSIVEHQSKSEIKSILGSHLKKRGVSNNALITESVMLCPPYTFTIESREDDAFHIEIYGDRESPSGHTSASFVAHNIVATRFRRNAIYFIFDNDSGAPVRDVLVPIQESRWEMLNTVPLDGSISKAEFMKRNRKDNGQEQSDAPRRWRELRNEFGFNVEEDGGMYHRGNQFAPTSMPEPRPDMSALKRKCWDEVYDRFDGRCNKCRQPVRKDAGDKEEAYGLIDHRTPVPFGGSDEIENLQLFCQTCNNRKTRVYEMHPGRFEQEFEIWAYPEKFRGSYHIRVSESEADWIETEAREKDVSAAEYAQTLLRETIQSRMG